MVFRDNTRRPVCSYGKVLYCWSLYIYIFTKIKHNVSSESTYSERLFKRYFLNVKLYYYFSIYSFICISNFRVNSMNTKQWVF